MNSNMSFDVSWDINKYREDNECEEHWVLRKAFIEKWKTGYPEERLICLARVFANIEFMGCRYPLKVMQEVARLSQDIVQQYRKSKRSKLQRTFVLASDAAEDRAKGVKREGGVIIDAPSPKSAKINFVPQGQTNNDKEIEKNNTRPIQDKKDEKLCSEVLDPFNYLTNMPQLKCLDNKRFCDRMFDTEFGKLVLLIRPWASKLCNIQSSCQACKAATRSTFEENKFSIYINNVLLAEAFGSNRSEARSAAEKLAWNKLRNQVVSVLIKEQWISQGDRISVNDVSRRKEQFGTPVENNVALKMMKLMGWKGGGLGADAQGIAEPIKPHLQMVNRAGLGSDTTDLRHLKKSGQELMRRFLASDTLDLDLVFSSEFSKEERALLHQCAQRMGLASRSYGDVDRFLVVKKKLNPFTLVHSVLEKGGVTPKYQVFLPESLASSPK